MSARIAIVTTKQPGTNPRMRKNADALSAAGYDVQVMYAFNAPWADETDRHVFERATWSHHRIGGHPKEAPRAYALQRLRRKWAASKIVERNGIPFSLGILRRRNTIPFYLT